jgi:type IV pilus assembly protein PilN
VIRINLLASERAQVKKKLTVPVGQKLTLACTLILVVGGLFVGWRYWSLTQESRQIDQDMAAAQQEVKRLQSILQQVQSFEQRKSQLSQRVVLIEDLRKAQRGPVHMLDQISRALPPMLWLTNVKQQAGDVLIEGNSTTQTGVSDFVTNLENSGYFRRSVEIVSTQTQPIERAPGELVRFTVRGQFQGPGAPPPPAPPARGRGAARGR